MNKWRRIYNEMIAKTTPVKLEEDGAKAEGYHSEVNPERLKIQSLIGWNVNPEDHPEVQDVPFSVLNDFEVPLAKRGRGIGTRLLKQFEEDAAVKGSKILLFQAWLKRKQKEGFDLKKFYEDRGYLPLGPSRYGELMYKPLEQPAVEKVAVGLAPSNDVGTTPGFTPKPVDVSEKPLTLPRRIGRWLGKQANTTVKVCLMGYPDEPSLKKIQEFKDGMDKGDMKSLPDQGTDGPHVTLRYWETDGLVADKVKKFVDGFLEKQKPLAVKTVGWKILGDKDTLVMELDGDGLIGMQKEIDDGLQELGVPPSEYSEFIPHISCFEGAKSTPKDKPGLDLKISKWVLSQQVKEPMGKASEAFVTTPEKTEEEIEQAVMMPTKPTLAQSAHPRINPQIIINVVPKQKSWIEQHPWLFSIGTGVGGTVGGMMLGKLLQQALDKRGSAVKMADTTVDMKAAVAAYLAENPSPDDETFHAWAESKGFNKHEAEEAAYELAAEAAAMKEATVKAAQGDLGGGLSAGKPKSKYNPKQVAMGMKVEQEHTPKPEVTREIARDHLEEDPKYYTHLKAMEGKVKAQKTQPVADMPKKTAAFNVGYRMALSKAADTPKAGAPKAPPAKEPGFGGSLGYGMLGALGGGGIGYLMTPDKKEKLRNAILGMLAGGMGVSGAHYLATHPGFFDTTEQTPPSPGAKNRKVDARGVPIVSPEEWQKDYYSKTTNIGGPLALGALGAAAMAPKSVLGGKQMEGLMTRRWGDINSGLAPEKAFDILPTTVKQRMATKWVENELKNTGRLPASFTPAERQKAIEGAMKALGANMAHPTNPFGKLHPSMKATLRGEWEQREAMKRGLIRRGAGAGTGLLTGFMTSMATQ